MRNALRRLIRGFGVDRPVFYSTIGQLWSLFSGPVTLILITTFLSEELQGYYYTFGSVAALQVFLELGFSYCITQFASHEAARLRFGADGSVTGEARARGRLLALGKLAMRWYAVVAVLTLGLVGICGHIFFSAKGDSAIGWVGPWWILCFAAAAALTIQPIGALIEGCNQMAFIYGLRTATRIASSVALWTAFLLGAGLYAAPALAITGTLIAIVGYYRKWPAFIRSIFLEPTTEHVSWKKEIWPFQWRIAVSWGCGYFIFSFFNPVIFWFHGEEAAGRMGASLQLLTSVSALAGVWIGSKGAHFGMLVKNRQFDALNREFKLATTQAVAMCILAGAAMLVGLYFLKQYFPRFGGRFLGVSESAFLVLAAVANQIMSGQAAYLRAFKREPFMLLSIVSSILNAVGLVVLAYLGGTFGACISYGVSQLACVFLSTSIWRKRSAEWQKEPPLE